MTNESNIELLINRGLIHRDDFARIAAAHIAPEFFTTQPREIFFRLARKVFTKHQMHPTKDMMMIELNQIAGLTDHGLQECKDYCNEVYTGPDEFAKVSSDWLIKESETWCQDRAVFLSVNKSVDILDGKVKENGQVIPKSAIPQLLQKAIAFTYNKDIGHEFVANAPQRYDLFHTAVHKIPFLIDDFNKMTDGGFERKTINILIGGTGKGKSLVLCSLAGDYLKLDKNVLYITLELADYKIAQRIDANMLNVPIKDLKNLTKERFLKKIDDLGYKSRLVVKSYPTSTAGEAHFRLLMDELKTKKNFVPDVVIVDYMGICKSTQYGKTDNMYLSGKGVAEELRAFAHDYDVCLLTAMQTNRTGHGSSDFDLMEVSESHGVAMTADWAGAIIVSDDLLKLSQMKIKQLKTRYDTLGNVVSFLVNVDYPKMRIFDNAGQSGFSRSNNTAAQPIPGIPSGSGYKPPKASDTPPWERPKHSPNSDDYVMTPMTKKPDVSGFKV